MGLVDSIGGYSILDEKYGNGEITKEEYLKLKQKVI